MPVVFGGNLVLGLHQTARVVPSRNVLESDIVRQRAEEGNSFTNEHRYSRDNKALNDTGA